MKKVLLMISCLLWSMSVQSITALAAIQWPEGVPVESEAGIVMDADTGAVLYGKNIHQQLYPASITKVLTALIVLEHADPDDMVTFSRDAVLNVEEGSQSMGLAAGDQLSVRDCLYGLLLKSANETANALAEHVAGSVEAFCGMMNEKASSLGCTESNFANPSGLNDPNHYVTAYDMALITRAAFENEEICKITATPYYEIPPTSLYPEGQGISPGNKMIKTRYAEYYPDVIGGKTGYTSLAGNTLVICAKRGNTKLVTVILNSKSNHYEDTKALLDFGFSNFQSVKACEADTTYSATSNDLIISGLSAASKPFISIDRSSRVSLPKGGLFSDLTSEITYNLDGEHPEDAIAQISYYYNDRFAGKCFLTMDIHADEGTSLPSSLITPSSKAPVFPSTDVSASPLAVSEEATVSQPALNLPTLPVIPAIFWKIMTGILVAGAIVALLAFYFIHRYHKEQVALKLRKERRLQRLQDNGLTQVEFEALVNRRRYKRRSKKK